VHRALRRFAALLVLAVPISFIGSASATWGPPARVPPPLPRDFVASPLAVEAAAEERTESAVVLVVLDGVRWQEFFGGADRALLRERGMNPVSFAGPRALLPNVAHALDMGAVAIGGPRGPEIAATGPRFISMPGYLEIFDGRPDPGCEANDCVRPPVRTIVDDVLDASDVDGTEAAVVASWPNIARAAAADPSRVVISAGRHRVERENVLRADESTAALLDRGRRARAFPGEGDYRPDAITARIALQVLAVERPRFLFVGLGDADEYGHRNDYMGYLQAVHASDAFLGELFATLGGMGARGKHTTVLVTADHGRAYGFKDHGARYPESGRVWLLAAGGDVHGRGAVAASRRHTLSDVAPTVMALLGMHSEGEPIPEIAAGRPSGSPAAWFTPPTAGTRAGP
jgi:Metalloenzyme superfamily